MSATKAVMVAGILPAVWVGAHQLPSGGACAADDYPSIWEIQACSPRRRQLFCETAVESAQRWRSTIDQATSTARRTLRRTPASRSPRWRTRTPVAPLALSSGRFSRRRSHPGAAALTARQASLTSVFSGKHYPTARRLSVRGTRSQQPAGRVGGSVWSSRLSLYEPPSRWTPRSACPLSSVRRRCWWARSRRARC